MTNKEAIDRWAEYIIPAVFKAEDALQKAKPEWKERLKHLGESGGNAASRKLACAFRDAMERSSLSSKEKIDLLEKYQQELTK